MKLRNKKSQKRLKILSCFLLTCSLQLQADVLTDGTVGNIHWANGNMIIPESWGTVVGDNLFQSFAFFNILNGESATFTGSSHLQNVIARVTGGDASLINGVLRSNIGKSNFYLINPAGVVFGANAAVDVPGSFHVSSANQIKFTDGSVFSATNPTGSSLTVANPASFGFLGQTGDIVLDGAQIIAKPNQTIDLVANNITLKNEATAAASEVRLVATKGSQNISLVRDANGFLPLPSSMPNEQNGGNIVLDTSSIFSSDNGNIRLWGENILLSCDENCYNYPKGIQSKNGSNVFVKADSLNMDNGAEIDSFGDVSLTTGSLSMNRTAWINANRDISVTTGSLSMNEGTVINANRHMSITTGSLNMNDAGISSFTEQENAGDISVTASSLNINGGGIYSASDVSVTVGSLNMNRGMDSGAEISGYNVSVTASNYLNMAQNARIDSYSYTGSKASDVSVTAGSLNMDSNARIFSYSYQGKASDVSVTAGSLSMDYLTAICSLSESGTAGDVSVTARSLSMDKGARIYSHSYSAVAGNVSVTSGFLSMDNKASISSGYHNDRATGTGIAGDVSVTAGSLIINSDSKIVGYDNGNVNLTAGNAILLNGGLISHEAFKEGSLGMITINADSLLIDRQGSDHLTGISSVALTQETTPIPINAGNININVKNRLALLLGGVITSSSLTHLANAGHINVNTGDIFIDGFEGGTDRLTIYVYNSANKEFEAKYIQLNHPILPGISSDTFFGGGQAGNINITTNTLDIINGSAISTETLASNGSNGGNISVNAKDHLYLENSGITTSTNGATSNGGNININSPVLVMDTGLIQANAEGGHGGDINLNLQALIPSYKSLILSGEQVLWEPYIPGFNVIQAASAAGVNGTVNPDFPAV